MKQYILYGVGTLLACPWALFYAIEKIIEPLYYHFRKKKMSAAENNEYRRVTFRFVNGQRIIPQLGTGFYLIWAAFFFGISINVLTAIFA